MDVACMDGTSNRMTSRSQTCDRARTVNGLAQVRAARFREHQFHSSATITKFSRKVKHFSGPGDALDIGLGSLGLQRSADLLQLVRLDRMWCRHVRAPAN